MGKREQQNKRSYEQVEGDDSMVGVREQDQQMDVNDSNNNPGNKLGTTNNNNKKNMKKQQEQAHVKEEEEFEDAEQDDDDEDDEDEEDVVEEEEEIEEEVEEDEEEEDDEDENESGEKGTKSTLGQSTNQASQSGSQQNSNAANTSTGNVNTDKRPRLTEELYEMNLRRKKEHVGSALYIPFPRKVSEEEVRGFVGQGPNIFLVGPQKQNAIVRYRTQSDCEKQQKELAKKEFEGQTLNIEPKTVKIDPANIDVKTLIVQYSNPDLSIMDFAQIFIKAISISLKGGKSKKESQEDLSFGSAIIIFPSHEEAKEAFLATENLNIKNEQLRVVFADFRPLAGSSTRTGSGGFGFRNKGGDNNRGNFNRGGNQGGRPGGGNFRNRNRNQSGGGGNQRNFGNRNFNQNSGGGGNYNQGGGGRNYSPNKKFRSNVR